MNEEIPCPNCPSFAFCLSKVKTKEREHIERTQSENKLHGLFGNPKDVKIINLEAIKHLCINTVVLPCDIVQDRWLSNLMGIDNTKQFKRKLIDLYFNEE